MFHALLEWKVYCVYKILNLYSSFVGSRPEAKKKKKGGRETITEQC